MTEDQAPEIARFLSREARRRLLHGAQAAARQGQPLRVPRPPRPLDAGHRRPPGGRGPRLRRAVDPPRPGAQLPGPRHRRQPGRLHGDRQALRRPGGDLQQGALGQGRQREVRGRRRQPDPARRQHHGPGGRRPGPAHHHRPRPAVVHPAGAPPGRRERRRQLRHRGGHGLPDRRGPRAGRRPDVRRRRPGRLAGQRTAGPARSTSPTSPARWRRCSPSPRSSTPARSTRAPRCWCPASCTVRTASSTTTGTTG